MQHRPLKFRFWNKLAKTYKRSWRNAICHDGTFIEWEPEATSYSDPIDFSMSIIVAQQYTGLKDKNGKEIYEGDIIQKIVNSEYIYTYIVGYDESKASFTIKDTLESLISFVPVDTFQIIGNIYENPELLSV